MIGTSVEAARKALEVVIADIQSGETVTPQQIRQLEALAVKIQELRNYAICMDSGKGIDVAKKYGITGARVSQIRAVGIHPTFMR